MPLKDTFDKAKEAGINLAGKAWEKGSDLAGKAWEKGSDFADRAKEKAKSTARIAKLNFEIKAEENTIEKAYREIGRLYYETCGANPEGFFIQLCEEISACCDHIDEMEAEIAALKAGSPVDDSFDGFEDAVEQDEAGYENDPEPAAETEAEVEAEAEAAVEAAIEAAVEAAQATAPVEAPQPIPETDPETPAQ